MIATQGREKLRPFVKWADKTVLRADKKMIQLDDKKKNYQVLRLDVSVEDLPEQTVVLLVLDVEDEAAVLVLVLGADFAVVQVEQVLLDVVAQLEAKEAYKNQKMT